MPLSLFLLPLCYQLIQVDVAIADDKSKSASLKGLLGDKPKAGAKEAPLFIKSDSLEVNSKERVFIYKNNVELTKDDLKVTANFVEGYYSESNDIEKITCRGNVVITKGTALKATANRALYKVAAAIIELTENPEVYKEDNVLAADKIRIFVNEDRSEAEGNVRVKVIKADTTMPADSPATKPAATTAKGK